MIVSAQSMDRLRKQLLVGRKLVIQDLSDPGIERSACIQCV